MKKFITRMKEERTPHERRQFSLKVAGMVTAVLFVGWLATLGVRLSNTQAPVVTQGGSGAAATLIAVQGTEDEHSQVGSSVGWFDFSALFGR